MNKTAVKSEIQKGNTIHCTKEDYHQNVRSHLQDVAGDFIDNGDHLRGQIALMEVQRLDNAHGSEPQGGQE